MKVNIALFLIWRGDCYNFNSKIVLIAVVIRCNIRVNMIFCNLEHISISIETRFPGNLVYNNLIKLFSLALLSVYIYIGPAHFIDHNNWSLLCQFIMVHWTLPAMVANSKPFGALIAALRMQKQFQQGTCSSITGQSSSITEARSPFEK